MQKESDFEYFLRKKEENKKIFIYILIGIIIAVVSAAIIVLLFIYFNENEIPNENLTNNETSNENNLPAPTNEINLTNNNLTNPPASSGGGFSPSSSSSPSSTPSPSCTPNKTCSYYYNLNQCGTALSDGCTNSLSCTSCTNGTCSNNTCIQLPSCTSDTDCGNLTGICGTGTCNLTSGSCYINYLAGSICRNSTNECDAVETCISGILSCPADINKTDGETCSIGTCQGGICKLACTNDYGCNSAGSFCEGNMIYTCSIRGDGCFDRTNGTVCGTGNYCSNGNCVIGTPITYKIVASAGIGGIIMPNGTLFVNEGNDLSFIIIPDAGYIISDVKTSWVAEGAIPSYIMRNIRANNSINAYFLPEANLIPETIYVDGQLVSNCNGTYSISNRDCSGSDGDAYKTIGGASDVAGQGDTVLIRGGVYNYGAGPASSRNVLWPKHSGTPQNPITFKNYPGEEVVIGRDVVSFPNDYEFSIARAVISMRNVHDIIIEGLKADYVAGWVYARGCSNITLRNNIFMYSTWDSKGTARFIDSNYNKIINNTFLEAGANGEPGAADALQIVASNYNLIENNTFDSATHALLAVRCGNFNVIRNNYFTNPWYYNDYQAEKLTEEYDCRYDRNDPANPSYIADPQYDSTKYNLFERNWFGYHPDYSPSQNRGSRTSAMQFSGQNTIIRNNIYSNPPLKQPNPLYPTGYAGGVAIVMRWGGSWEGWDNKSQKLIGEGPEAGFVYGNRIYNNVFNGYDGSKITFPDDDSVSNLPTYAPMKNVENYEDYPFNKTWEFDNNVLKNNIFNEGRFLARNTWLQSLQMNGTPAQIVIRGRENQTLFENNDFYASPPNETKLIYDLTNYPYTDFDAPGFFNTNAPWSFKGNVQLNPGFIDSYNENFGLIQSSPMIDAGTFLTKTASAGSGTSMQVEDAGYFFDGYGLAGEIGDLIQLEGQTQAARILHIDYATNTITLNQPLTWTSGQGVSLAYSGSAPDIGAYEYQGTELPSLNPFVKFWNWLKSLF